MTTETIAHVSDTEREVALVDGNGATQHALIDEEKGWATPLGAGEGGAS